MAHVHKKNIINELPLTTVICALTLIELWPSSVNYICRYRHPLNNILDQLSLSVIEITALAKCTPFNIHSNIQIFYFFCKLCHFICCSLARGGLPHILMNCYI